MSARRPVRIDFELPELTLAQAHTLWTFLDELASNIWDAYETELLKAEDQLSRLPLSHNDSTHPDHEIGSQNYWPRQDATDEGPDPDF
jgi:hypothetical protein